MAWSHRGRGFVDDDGGLWRSTLDGRGADGSRRPALFLDRDGVVVEEVDYLRRVEDVRLLDGAVTAIAAANRAGLPVVVVTNQSGIARGYFDWATFEAIHYEIDRRLAEHGARIDAVYACGYHEKGTGALALASHAWRKPGPGMILAAADDRPTDLAGSLLVGDKASDLAAAKAAGLGRGALVRTGYGAGEAEITAARRLADPRFAVSEVDDAGVACAIWLNDLRAHAREMS